MRVQVALRKLELAHDRRFSFSVPRELINFLHSFPDLLFLLCFQFVQLEWLSVPDRKRNRLLQYFVQVLVISHIQQVGPLAVICVDKCLKHLCDLFVGMCEDLVNLVGHGLDVFFVRIFCYHLFQKAVHNVCLCLLLMSVVLVTLHRLGVEVLFADWHRGAGRWKLHIIYFHLVEVASSHHNYQLGVFDHFTDF